jgi:hypothetical protein
MIRLAESCRSLHSSARSNGVSISLLSSFYMTCRLNLFSLFTAIESLVTAEFRGMTFENEDKGL